LLPDAGAEDHYVALAGPQDARASLTYP